MSVRAEDELSFRSFAFDGDRCIGVSVGWRERIKSKHFDEHYTHFLGSLSSGFGLLWSFWSCFLPFTFTVLVLVGSIAFGSEVKLQRIIQDELCCRGSASAILETIDGASTPAARLLKRPACEARELR